MTHAMRYLGMSLLCAAMFAATARGQADFGADAFSAGGAGPSIGNSGGDAGFSIPGLHSGAGLGSASTATIELSAGYRLAPDERSGILTVVAQVPPRHHIYSLTQPKGAIGVKSTLTLLSTDVVTLDGRGFVATPSPTPKSIDPKRPAAEEHFGKVEWSVPFEVADGVSGKTLAIGVRYDGQICSEPNEKGLGGSCFQIDGKEATAAFQGMLTRAPEFVGVKAATETSDQVTTAKPYRADDSFAQIEISISPRVVAPGGQLTLTVSAQPDRDWHVYALAEKDPKKIGPKPTLIVLDSPRAWMTGAPSVSVEPIRTKSKSPDVPDYFVHDAVKWTYAWTVPEDAPKGALSIAGFIGYQTCRNEVCKRPVGIRFSGEVTVGDAAAGDASPIDIEETTYTAVAKLALARSQQAPVEANASAGALDEANVSAGTLDLHDIKPAAGSSLGVALGWALLGGFLLNFMPCVLPVLGLKVYSFVEMAGESRSKVFWHNVAYILGLLVVFWALGTVAVLFRTVSLFAGNAPLTLAMIGVVFAMALSFLGLWEIPIPGFAGSSPLNKLAEKENLAGAFFKGVIATILATPCGAPPTSLAFTQIFGRHPLEVYLIFTFVGLGMAAPYFLIALNPAIVARILPRPGAWMIVFKQALAFLLLGTVAWLVSTIHLTYALPTLVFIFGVWLACWIVGIGQHHYYSSVKMAGCWAAAGLVVAFSVLLAFADYGVRGVTTARFDEKIGEAFASARGTNAASPIATTEGGESTDAENFHLDWEPFSFERLQTLAAEGRPVVVDFTADWCPNCKVLEATVLNTRAVKEMVAAQGVVTLVADYTDRPKEIHALLERLTGSDLIPVLAIFPAGRAEDPIVFTGGYTTAMLLAELEKAGAPGADRTVASVAATETSR